MIYEYIVREKIRGRLYLVCTYVLVQFEAAGVFLAQFEYGLLTKYKRETMGVETLWTSREN